MKRQLKRPKTILGALVTLAMVISLFGTAVPAAGAVSSVNVILGVAPDVTYADGILQYTVTVINQAVPGANDAWVDLVFYPPGPSGGPTSLGTPVDLAIALYVTVGETVVFTWPSGGGDYQNAGLEVDLGAIPLDDGVTTVYGEVDFYALYNADPQYDLNDDRNIPAQIINPDTLVDIDASAYLVYAGDTVDLYVTECNTGDDPLDNVSVTVNDGSSDIATLVAPPDSGDTNSDGMLDPGECWFWTINGVVVNADTTFTATGYGEDSLGNPVTFPENELEQDDVTVEVSGNEGCTPGFWKNNAKNWDAVAWVGYAPGDSFETIFGVDVTLRGKGKSTYTSPTLLEALDANGGGINALARHAVAALLNISNPNIAYAGGMNVAGLILAVQNAVAMGEAAIEALHIELAEYNEAGCSINQRGEPIIPEDGIVI